jgi:DNA end-binding protein Ku
MKSMWKGSIGFGLVNIPVKLYSATQNSELDLDLLDKKDHAHIHYNRVNENSGKTVAWENIVKGYKYNDKYIVLTDQDFQSAAATKTQIIEIQEFVEEKEIDTIYYETPYYLEPEKSGARAYSLLHDALVKTKKVGLGTLVLRNKESIVLIKPYYDALVLNKLRFAEEIRDWKELDIPGKTTSRSKEADMAVSLVNQLSAHFNIENYSDTYTGKLMKIIKAKAKGLKIPEPKLKVVHRQSEDLMAQLKASLGEKKKRKTS